MQEALLQFVNRVVLFYPMRSKPFIFFIIVAPNSRFEPLIFLIIFLIIWLKMVKMLNYLYEFFIDFEKSKEKSRLLDLIF